MTARPIKRIGMLTPSSNTTVEPVTAELTAQVSEVSAHTARLRVTEITLDGDSKVQFGVDPMLAAADLLADARMHMMGWNGTAASWLGFDQDARLCAEITRKYDVPATTAVLAINDLLAEMNVRRLAVVSPYLDDVQARIDDNYRAAGFDVVAERHMRERVNYAFAEIPLEEIECLIREVAVDGPDAVVIMCTNMRGAYVADALERELDITVIDSLAAYVWKSLRLVDVDTARITGWGRLFNCTDSQAA